MKRYIALIVATLATSITTLAAIDQPYATGKEIGTKFVEAYLGEVTDDEVSRLIVDFITNTPDDKTTEHFLTGIEAGIYDACITRSLGEEQAETLYNEFLTKFRSDTWTPTMTFASLYEAGKHFGGELVVVVAQNGDIDEFSRQFVAYAATIAEQSNMDRFFKGVKIGIYEGCLEHNYDESHAELLYSNLHSGYFGERVNKLAQVGRHYGMKLIDEAAAGADIEKTIDIIAEQIKTLETEPEREEFFNGLREGILEGCEEHGFDRNVAEQIFNTIRTTLSETPHNEPVGTPTEPVEPPTPNHYEMGKSFGHRYIELIATDGMVQTHARNIGAKIDAYICDSITSDVDTNALFDGIKDGIREEIARLDLGTDSANSLYVTLYNCYRKSLSSADGGAEGYGVGSSVEQESTPYQKGQYFGSHYVELCASKGDAEALLARAIEYINTSNYTTEANQDFIAGFKRGVYDGCARLGIDADTADQIVSLIEEAIAAEYQNVGTL